MEKTISMNIDDLKRLQTIIRASSDEVSDFAMRNRYISWIEGFITAIEFKNERESTEASINVNHVNGSVEGLTLCGYKINGISYDKNLPWCEGCDD